MSPSQPVFQTLLDASQISKCEPTSPSARNLRPRGSCNKLGEQFIADLHETWKRRGIEAIERTIDEHPGQYLKVIAMLMPKDMNVNVRPLDHMSDEQLLRRLRQDTELTRPLLLAGRVLDIDP